MTNWSDTPFDFGAEMFDSRDAIERIDYLVDKADDVGLDEEEKDELSILNALREDAEPVTFDSGMTFISDDYFEEYAKQLAEDVGAVSDTDRWPVTCIDWEQAASELQQDYTPYHLQGTTYWSNGG